MRVANIQHLATPVRAQLISPRGAVDLAGLMHPTPAVGAEPLAVGAPLIPVGARIEGSINGFNHKNNISGDTKVLSATANAIVGLGMPYVIGGLGYYNARVKVGSLAEATKSGAGFNIGAGLTFPLPALSPYVEVRYHQMTGDASDVKFMPITFGINF